MKTLRPKHHDGYANALLRGLAIIAVITLHVLSGIHNGFSTTGSFWHIGLALDQLCRFSVPLFVALSGFGFWQKYQKVPFHWRKFLQVQSMKLLPLYVLASVVFDAIFWPIQHYMPRDIVGTFIWQLVHGKADYHLYFVPMIFQLYVLFPFVRMVVKKYPWISLFLAGIFQVGLYILFTSFTKVPLIAQYFATDQQQYFWFFSWIFYFVLGMHLPPMMRWIERRLWSLVALGFAAFLAWAWATFHGMTTMLQGTDPIIALRFTRVEVLVYASLMIVLLLTCAELANAKVRKMTKHLVLLGRFSYAIYLFHTLFVRLLFLGP